MQFTFSGLAQFVKEFFSEIHIEIEGSPSASLSAEIQIQLEESEYLYSQRWDRWFHASDITPLETTWGEDEAAITYDGLILFAFECVWGDGVTVSDIEIPSEKAAPVSILRQILNAPKTNGLVYEVGG